MVLNNELKNNKILVDFNFSYLKGHPFGAIRHNWLLTLKGLGCRGEECGRKVAGFSEKGLTFLGVRAILSWAQPPGHFDTVHLKCIAKVQLSKGPLAHFVRQQKKNFLFNGFLTFSGAEI